MKILLIGGGTGGHIIPLKNLAEELSKQKHQVEIIVSDSDLDKKITQENFPRNFKIHFFKTDKIHRYLAWQNLFAPFKIIKSIFFAKKLLSQIKPDIVFFKGGFVGFPFLMALFLQNFRGKIYGHESDIESGKLTKLLSQVADKVFYSFDEPPYPLFFEEKKSAKKRKTKNKTPQLLVFGGSQGAQFINELIQNNLEKLTRKFEIFLVTGIGKSISPSLNLDQEKFKQTEILTASELREKITESDLIVSRAGANSLFEIISAKKPSLIIPLPSAAKNHQEKNAKFFAEKGLCHIFHQGKDKNSDFYNKLIETFEDKVLRENLSKSKIQNSAKKIAFEITH